MAMTPRRKDSLVWLPYKSSFHVLVQPNEAVRKRLRAGHAVKVEQHADVGTQLGGIKRLYAPLRKAHHNVWEVWWQLEEKVPLIATAPGRLLSANNLADVMREAEAWLTHAFTRFLAEERTEVAKARKFLRLLRGTK